MLGSSLHLVRKEPMLLAGMAERDEQANHLLLYPVGDGRKRRFALGITAAESDDLIGARAAVLFEFREYSRKGSALCFSE